MARWALLAMLAVTGCATTSAVAPPAPVSAPEPEPAAYRRPAPKPVEPSLPPVRNGRSKVVATALAYLGHYRITTRGERLPSDCTGLVRAAYLGIGFTLMSEGRPGDNGVTAIWRFARMHGRLYKGGHALPGDLVFFRNTYDRNGDGFHDDGLTHVAIVEGEDRDGTIRLIHHTNHGVVRSHMNLRWPHLYKDASGKVLNDYLRAGRDGRPALTGELFAAFATLFSEPYPVARRSPHHHRPVGLARSARR